MKNTLIGHPNSKYVLLKGIKEGNVFWSTNSDPATVTQLADGTVVYEVLKFSDSQEEIVDAWRAYHGEPTLKDLIRINARFGGFSVIPPDED
jgi:hypothetical protein